MSPIRMSRVESGVRAVLELNEAFNRHDVPGMMQFFSDGCLVETAEPAPDGTRYSGKQAVRQYWQEFFRASPSAHREVEEAFGLGLRCFLRWKYSWAAEKAEYVRGTDIFHVKDGLITEMLSYVKSSMGPA